MPKYLTGKRRSIVVLVGIILLLLAVLLPTVVACDPRAPIRVENQTEQILAIFVRFGTVDKSHHLGDVTPGAEIRNKNAPIMISNVYYIEGKNPQEEVVYAKEFSYDELKAADWKVVIPGS